MDTSINDIIRAMRQNPDLRDELRREILTEELLAVPQRLSDLVTVVDDQGQRLSDLVTVVDAQGQRLSDLTTVVDAQGKRLADLITVVDAQGKQLADLITVVDAQGQRLSDLVTVVDAQGKQLADLITVVDARGKQLADLVTVTDRLGRDVEILKNDMGYVKGRIVETSSQGWIIPYLSSRLDLRRATVVRGPVLSGIAHDFEDAVEDAGDRGEITSNQRERIYSTDVVVRARRRESGETVYVPVEASFTIDYNDVDRAANSAIALRQVFPGVDVVPAVYGEAITQGGTTLAKGSGVSVLLRDPEPESPQNVGEVGQS